jgi:acyl carrier protein
MPTPTEIAIRDFLLSEVLYDRALADLPVDENLIDRGLLDSLGLQRMVTFCEEQFGVAIPDAEVLPDNMESVAAMARLVERVRARK